MYKKVKFVDLNMYNSNVVHNESPVNKSPKKKMYDQSSIELNTYTEEDICEKNIEQNITDFYSRKNVSQKGKFKINALENISLVNNCSMDNEKVPTKKQKKKRNHNKRLNSIYTNTNHDTEILEKNCEEVNEQNINNSDYRENVNQIIKSELNTSSDISLENKCSIDNDNFVTKKPKKKKNHNTSLNSVEINTNNNADYKTYEKDNEPESTENITKKKMSEVNVLTNKKSKKNKKHNKSLNTITETAIKSPVRTFVEINEKNIEDSDFRENVKKLRSKKTYIESLNLIKLDTTNDAEIKSDRTCEEVNEQNIDSYSRKNVSRKRKSEINALSDISLSENCSIDNENVPTKKIKKKKNHDGSLNSIEFNTNHDSKIQVFKRTYEVVNNQNIGSSDFRKNMNQTIKSELNTSSNISAEINCSMDYDNFAIKKPKRKKKHDKSLDLIKLSTNNDAVNDSNSTKNISQKIMSEINALPIKKPKKKKNHTKSLNSIELDTINHDREIQIFEKSYDEVNDQNINDSDYRENVNQIIKSELNASSDISLENKCSIDNDNFVTKKPKKKKNHNTSLNLVEINTNNNADYKTYEKDNEPESTENITKKKMSEVNVLTNKKSKKNKKHNKSLNTITETAIKSPVRTFVEINEKNIEDSDFRENVKKLRSKKTYIESLNLIELDTTNDAEIKSDRTCEEFNEQNIDSYSRKNVSRKRKSEINALSDISLSDNCSIDNENVPTKKIKKKKNHDGSLNSIEFNTNHDSKIQVFKRTYEVVNNQNIDSSDFRKNMNQTIKSELNTSSNISAEINCSMDYDNFAIKKPKRKKKHDKSLDLIKLSTNNDAVNDSNSTKNISQKIMSVINALPIKKPKKKKNHTKSLNSIELDTINHDREIQIFEKSYDEVNDQNIIDSDYRDNVNQIIMSELNASSDISLENKCSMDNDNVDIKKPKKKKSHNTSLNSIEIKTNNDVDYRTYEKDNEHNINDSDSTKNIIQKKLSEINALPTKTPKKNKNHNKSLNLIEFSTNHDTEIQIFERTCEEVNDSDCKKNGNQIIKPELNTLSDILLENKLSMDSDNVATKKPKKKEKHNKSLNSIELNTDNDACFRTNEKDNEHNINGFDCTKNISLKRISELNALADISLGNDFRNDNENVSTKISKKEKNHNKSLNSININTNHDNEIKTYEKPCIEVSEPNMNDSYTKALASTSLEINSSLDNENLATKEFKKREEHDKTVNNLNMPMISQNHSRLKTLLNSMELHNFEELSTNNNTNFNLKRFNLMKYLLNKDPSLKQHPNFKQINENLSKKIKSTINKKYELEASDVLLLKTVGKIILKKIVEKIDSAQDITDLVIKLPPECMENKIHFIETSLSRLPNKSKMDIIKKQNPLVKLRIFNKDEDNMIREYWSKFKKEYNISNILPFLSNGLEIALSPKERLQFIRYISAGLPNRLLYSVFNRFNILFNEYQDKTCFSEEEDQLIMKVDKCDAIKNKFSVLSLILNRTRIQLYRRHEVLKNQHKKCKHFLWDDQKRQELFTNILLETNTEHWTQLKNLTITKDTWIKIAKNLGEDITYNQVRYQWNYLYTMLFCEKPIFMSTFNLTVLELIIEKNPKHWSDLNWIEITNTLYPGANSKIICGFFHSWIGKKVPSEIKDNIRDTLDYLKWYEVDKLKIRINKNGEREFPRFTVKDYDLLVVNQHSIKTIN